MMNNLFSIFDPSSSTLSTSWTIMILSPMMLTKNTWMTKTPTKSLINITFTKLKKEVKTSLNIAEKGSENTIMLAFSLILLMNLTALYPHIFSATSHLAITLPLSLTMWTLIMMFGITNNKNHMLIHMVPQGTPNMLMPFMVLIELVSNTIRPITLCVRLTANLIAGHLLMSLLGSSLNSVSLEESVPLIPVQLILTTLELAVSFIQSYVFMTLVTLYTAETK